ncbi:MAG: transketolase [Tepidanaerobacteraceae bacterium]|jgi:transketolase
MTLPYEKHQELKNISRNIRRHIIEMTAEAGSGHPGGSLSCADILSVLYFHVMRINPQDPLWPDRDRLVLSKGHAAPALYAALAERGYFPKKELLKLRKFGAILQGHPDMNSTPGLDMTTGSLGQGLSVANGMALAARIDNRDYRVYVILGDGEAEEGQVWEAAMTSSHYKLDNLMVFLDYNRLQIDGPISEIISPESFYDKFKSFGWHVLEIEGHDIGQIVESVEQAKVTKGKPTAVIAHTIKGKGVAFMENQVGWHGKAPTREQAEEALKAL